MKKLNKRQIIILTLAALFVLYAVYELFLAGPAAKKPQTQAGTAPVDAFVSELGAELLQQKMVGVDAYIAKNAEIEWAKNPFWEKAAYREFLGKDTVSADAAKFLYSGYVDTGRKKMAIINGWEYEAGESLDIEGYVVKHVAPSRVVIVNRKTGEELHVPIQE